LYQQHLLIRRWPLGLKKLLVLSDIHGAASKAKRLEQVTRDYTIVAGDIAECGSLQEALEILDILASQGAPVLWVPGNCDDPRLASVEKEHNLHTRSVRLDGLVFAGAGGSLHTPFATPFEYGEDELRRILEQALRGVREDDPLVLVVHTPPYRSGLDRVRGGSYVGSRFLTELLEKRRPLLLATGHIHEAWGVAAPAGVIAVNPGPLASGHYALVDLDLENMVVRARTRRLSQ
jgi:Icc-related predicted phosphoesterase